LEGRRQTEHLREHRSSLHHRPAAAFFVQDGWNAEPGLLHQGLLDQVADPGDLRRRHGRGAANPGHLTDAVLKSGGDLRRVNLAFCLELVHPARTQLGELLVQRHLR
jgi:hypothetical protein